MLLFIIIIFSNPLSGNTQLQFDITEQQGSLVKILE